MVNLLFWFLRHFYRSSFICNRHVFIFFLWRLFLRSRSFKASLRENRPLLCQYLFRFLSFALSHSSFVSLHFSPRGRKSNTWSSTVAYLKHGSCACAVRPWLKLLCMQYYCNILQLCFTGIFHRNRIFWRNIPVEYLNVTVFLWNIPFRNYL